MRDDSFRKYEPFFGKWLISKELGKGAYGRVFEICWEDGLGGRSRSALKIIHIPSEEALRVQKEQQPNMEAVRNFFAGQVERIKEEIRILQKCKGHSNIVSYEDHLIVENPGDAGIGWDILIRMELLYPLQTYFSRKDATQMDVIRMWLHITAALIYCEELGIIHRDIKPANILVSDAGMFKLSDFGAARKSMQGQDATTRIGTERYMAPEVYKNQRYDKRADYYSLGCVIYYYLNNRRHPFLPHFPREVEARDYEAADLKRIGGEKIPKIPGLSRAANAVLLRSLAYRPQDRYRSAVELYEAVQGLLARHEKEFRSHWLDPAREVQTHTSFPERSEPMERRSAVWVGAACVFLAAGTASLLLGGRLIAERARQKSELSGEADPTPGAAAEIVTEAVTEAQSEPVTETEPIVWPEPATEIVTEPMTEAVTEAETEPATEAASEEAAEPPGPTARLYGELYRPIDGETVDLGTDQAARIGVMGWILTSADVEGITMEAEILSKGKEIASIPITGISPMGEERLARAQKKYSAQIDAAAGYELEERCVLPEMSEGEYQMRLWITEAGSEERELFQTAGFTLSSERTLRQTEESEAEQTERFFYQDPEGDFALGLDEESRRITASADQIIFTGWINADSGTGLSLYLQVDDVFYTGDAIAAQGGELLLEQVPRNLEALPVSERGEELRDSQEAGIIVSMRLPFLEDGEHALRLSFDIAPPGQGVRAADLGPVSLTIDSALLPREMHETQEMRIEQLRQAWEQQP